MASSESFVHGAAELMILEVDGALLQEILDDLDKDDVVVGSSCGSGEYVVQPLEVHHPSPVLEAPNSEQERFLVQDPDWR
ncbi:hypothetical protein NL676_001066 [Syzygium grande]|nr:hypothetical protein NL676_001066 [Syzygium grande]